MNRKKWLTRILIFSIIFNVIFLFGAGLIIAKNGGLAYISYKISHQKKESFFPLYHTGVSIFNGFHQKDNQIVFLGDSIIALNDWNELLEINNSVNRGISGDTTDGVLNRLSQVTKTHPTKLFLLVGINDLQAGKSDSSVATNYKKIIDTIRKDSPETKIIMTSVLPVSNKKYIANFPIDPKEINIKVVLLNKELQKLIEENKVYYLDLFKELVDSKGELNSTFTFDGLHIDGNGYTIWKEKLKEYITVR